MSTGAESIWNPDRTLTNEALSNRALACVEFFQSCLRQRPNSDWAMQSLQYSVRFYECLTRSPIDETRCRRLGHAAQKRFRRSHPSTLAALGTDLVMWIILRSWDS